VLEGLFLCIRIVEGGMEEEENEEGDVDLAKDK
jgi:hypothetical protein